MVVGGWAQVCGDATALAAETAERASVAIGPTPTPGELKMSGPLSRRAGIKTPKVDQALPVAQKLVAGPNTELALVLQIQHEVLGE